MIPSNYTEDTLVQQTTAEYLEQQLRWDSVYAYNNEDFGPDSLLGRRDDREVVLTRYLRAALVWLNPGLPKTAYDDTVRQIVTTVATQTLLATNSEKYKLIKNGVQVTFRNDKGERVRQRLRVIDFDEPANNHFLCVRELWARGDLYRRRADIVGFVNGLPLLFMEMKNVSKDIRAAYEKNFKDYKDTVSHLFHHNALVVLAKGVDAKLGSVTRRFEHFHECKRLAEVDFPIAVFQSIRRRRSPFGMGIRRGPDGVLRGCSRVHRPGEKRDGTMTETPRNQAMNPGESSKVNTNGMLRLFVYGTPETCLPAIDRLEGFHPGDPSLYRRVLVPVCISGQISPAWVYVGAPKHRERRSLPNGIWPE